MGSVKRTQVQDLPDNVEWVNWRAGFGCGTLAGAFLATFVMLGGCQLLWHAFMGGY